MILYLRQRLVNGESPQSSKLSFQVILQKCEDQATCELYVSRTVQ